jgi:hypothetical protein
MVLEQAVVDGRLAKDSVDHVKLPKEHARKGGHFGVVDDPTQFLSWCRFRRSSRRRLGPTPNLRKSLL